MSLFLGYVCGPVLYLAVAFYKAYYTYHTICDLIRLKTIKTMVFNIKIGSTTTWFPYGCDDFIYYTIQLWGNMCVLRTNKCSTLMIAFQVTRASMPIHSISVYLLLHSICIRPDLGRNWHIQIPTSRKVLIVFHKLSAAHARYIKLNGKYGTSSMRQSHPNGMNGSLCVYVWGTPTVASRRNEKPPKSCEI